MADHSTIEWTDATWNVITGCSIESPGCTNCYAMKLAGGRLQHHASRAGLTRPSAKGPVWTGEVRFNRQWLEQPIDWKRPRDIFVCAHGDLFHPDVRMSWHDEVFGVMRLAPHHRFQVLTKRPQVALAYIDSSGWRPMEHVLIGASVEDQRYADERRGAMQSIAERGWRTWVSYEPALGAVDWSGWSFIEWMVSGGESGAHARPSHPDWHRSTRDWCAQHGVQFLFKQWGQWMPVEATSEDEVFADDGSSRELQGRVELNMSGTMGKVGKKVAGRLLDGIEHNGMPA